MVKRWYADFKHGRIDTNDAECSGCPNLEVVLENTKILHKLVLANHKLKWHEIAEGSVFTILHERLSMRKLCSKWVPHLLIIDQKQQHVNNSMLLATVSMQQMMKHGFTISLWSQIGSQLNGQKQVKAVQSNQRHKHQQSKILVSIFGDAQGILFIDCLEKGKTINSQYYRALLVRLNEEIAKKQPQMKKKKVLFHQDNALCHKSNATIAKLHELPLKLLPHPPYSPHLAPSDYWLFTDLKRML